MTRMQILLGPKELQALRRQARETEKSYSQLVREAIGQAYVGWSAEQFLEAWRNVKGIWKDRTDLPSTVEYIRRIRRDRKFS